MKKYIKKLLSAPAYRSLLFMFGLLFLINIGFTIHERYVPDAEAQACIAFQPIICEELKGLPWPDGWSTYNVPPHPYHGGWHRNWAYELQARCETDPATLNQVLVEMRRIFNGEGNGN